MDLKNKESEKDHKAKVVTTVHAPIEKVWNAFVDPQTIKEYCNGTDVISEWKEGREIKWKGGHEGNKFEDKGKIIRIQPESLLQYTRYSQLSGREDIPENYNTVTIALSENRDGVLVSLAQDNNFTEKRRIQSERTWQRMLDELKELLEK